MTKAAAKKRPRGIYVLALFMFLIGGIALLAGLILPIQGGNIAPWYVYLSYAAYLVIVGWGLWGMQRWAYFAALLMCLVLGFYQLQTALLLEQNVLLQALMLAAIFFYLLRPQVRAAFLGRSIEESGGEEQIANQ